MVPEVKTRRKSLEISEPRRGLLVTEGRTKPTRPLPIRYHTRWTQTSEQGEGMAGINKPVWEGTPSLAGHMTRGNKTTRTIPRTRPRPNASSSENTGGAPKNSLQQMDDPERKDKYLNHNRDSEEEGGTLCSPSTLPADSFAVDSQAASSTEATVHPLLAPGGRVEEALVRAINTAVDSKTAPAPWIMTLLTGASVQGPERTQVTSRCLESRIAADYVNTTRVKYLYERAEE